MTRHDDRDPDHCTDLDCELDEFEAAQLDEPELCVDCEDPLDEGEYPRCGNCRYESDHEEYLRRYYDATRL